MVRRSVLFTPGDRPEMLRKAPDFGADVLVFDLEDAVAPARKDEARRAVRDVLVDPSFDPDNEVCVRVGATREAAREDIDVLFGGDDVRLDGLVLPKAASAGAVERLAGIAEEQGYSLPVLAIVESARGVQRADAIADAAPTDALVFGAEDFAADVGARRTTEGFEVSYARQRVVVAAAAAGIDAIDTLVTEFDDQERLRAEAARAVDLGFDGKLAIHPAQIGPIHEAFAPTKDELAWAREVLEATRAADAEGRGVVRVDGEMIDAPLVERAETIVERERASRGE